MINTPAFTTKRRFKDLGFTEESPQIRVMGKENHVINLPYCFAQPKLIIHNKDPFVSFAQTASNILANRSNNTHTTPLQPTKVEPFSFSLDKRIRTHADMRDDYDNNTYKFKALELDKSIFNNPKPLLRSKSVTEFKEFNLSRDIRSLKIEDETPKPIRSSHLNNSKQFEQPDPLNRSKVLKKEVKYKSTTDLKSYLDKSLRMETPKKCNAKLLRTESRAQQRRIPF